MTDAPERIWACNWLADVGETSVWDIGEWRDEPWQTVGTVEYVRATDYDALVAKLAEVTDDCDNLQIALASARKQLKRYIEEAEAHIAHLENHIESVAKDTHKIMVAYEAALPAAYRLGLEAAAKRVEARAAGNPLHVGQYANSAFVIRRLPTPTAAELRARIQTGEKE